MNWIQIPDPHPGRCLNTRPIAGLIAGLGVTRCVRMEGHHGARRFEVTMDHLVSVPSDLPNLPADPIPWVEPPILWSHDPEVHKPIGQLSPDQIDRLVTSIAGPKPEPPRVQVFDVPARGRRVTPEGLTFHDTAVGILAAVRVAARQKGYAIAFHGSLANDLDLVAIPWTDDAESADDLVAWIVDQVGGYLNPQDQNPEPKPHGRLAWAIHILGTAVWVDLSVMSREAEQGVS